MKTKKKTQEEGSRFFDRFVEAVLERQRLEELYYVTGENIILEEIKKARERIKDIERGFGLKIDQDL